MSNDCRKTSRGIDAGRLVLVDELLRESACVKPSNGIRTLGSLSSGVIFTPSSRNSAMLSACVSSVPVVDAGLEAVARRRRRRDELLGRARGAG